MVEKDSWIHITEAKKFESLLVRGSVAPAAWPQGREEGSGCPPQPHQGEGASGTPAPASRACRVGGGHFLGG